MLTEFVANKKFAFRDASGSVSGSGAYLFEAVNGGTRVTVTAEGETGGLFKLAEPVLTRMAKRQIETSNHNLKDYMESGAD